ncbi:TIGR03915 family putative DNA repair protein [Rubrivirga sp. IMCC45206]|uniref:TIGR03915 family putative DNA repair protein n=1 Tax=Rubrivirga sp. IMCC45206 TaxID=3391614 RepID=UPI00399037B7
MSQPPALPVDPHLAVETDGTFAGLLCAYAAAYRQGALPASVGLIGAPADGALFGAPIRVETEAAIADRVERGLDRLVPGLVGRLRRAVLSERPGIEVAALRLADAVRAEGAAVAEDWTFDPAREVGRWSGRVGREAHRMEAFVRFEEHVADGVETWTATARPEYHVLPILHPHFEARYPTLAWRIVDARRGLALVHTPEPDRAPGDPASRIVPAVTLGLADAAPDEAAYQTMWKAYFQAVTIPERRNLKLHLRHVPKRYWPYLTEKQTLAPLAAPVAKARAPRAAVPASGPPQG